MTHRLRPALPQVTVSRPIRPDLWTRYPDPRLNFRHATPYGLTVDELRAEWKRQVDAGWARWELELRLHPAEVAA